MVAELELEGGIPPVDRMLLGSGVDEKGLQKFKDYVGVTFCYASMEELHATQVVDDAEILSIYRLFNQIYRDDIELKCMEKVLKNMGMVQFDVGFAP